MRKKAIVPVTLLLCTSLFFLAWSTENSSASLSITMVADSPLYSIALDNAIEELTNPSEIYKSKNKNDGLPQQVTFYPTCPRITVCNNTCGATWCGTITCWVTVCTPTCDMTCHPTCPGQETCVGFYTCTPPECTKKSNARSLKKSFIF